METWVYMSILSDGPSLEETMRPLGEQGWEAVGFAPVILHASTTTSFGIPETHPSVVTEWRAEKYRVLLKRRKP